MKDARVLSTRAPVWIVVVAVLLLAGAAVLALAGCGTAKTVEVTIDDDGGSVTVPGDGTLEVSLLGNPSTGYSWVVVDDAGGILTQIGDPAAEKVDPNAGSSGAKVGMSERQTFQFDAAKAGSGQLTMEYKRAWETVPAEQTFTLEVTVE